jgi:hypothetical protein
MRKTSRMMIVERPVLLGDNVAASLSTLPGDQTQLVGHNQEMI